MNSIISPNIDTRRKRLPGRQRLRVSPVASRTGYMISEKQMNVKELELWHNAWAIIILFKTDICTCTRVGVHMAAFEEVGICPELVHAASDLGWRWVVLE